MNEFRLVFHNYLDSAHAHIVFIGPSYSKVCVVVLRAHIEAKSANTFFEKHRRYNSSRNNGVFILYQFYYMQMMMMICLAI